MNFAYQTPLRAVADPCRVLLVEDCVDVREALAEFLRGFECYDVVDVESAEAGLEALRSGRGFDIVLSDYDLPNENGAWMLSTKTRLAPSPAMNSACLVACKWLFGWVRIR